MARQGRLVGTMHSHFSWPRRVTKLSPLLFVEGACLRRICMTAVRRLMLLTCAMAVLPLSAQTSRGTKTTPASPPAPAAAAASTPVSQDVQATPRVTAETDADANNPRALRISLDSAVKTSLTENLGVDLTRYDYRENS